VSNNEAEALALIAGDRLGHSEGIQNLVICGESLLIIHALVKGSIVGGNFFVGVMFCSLESLKKFSKHSLFHVKRGLNVEADSLAKNGSRLAKGTLVINGNVGFAPIP
jgi:ribonuclease HI